MERQLRFQVLLSKSLVAQVQLSYISEQMQVKNISKSQTRAWQILLVAIICLFGSTLLVYHFTSKDPWPSAELVKGKTSIHYPIYYPSHLPKGFSYDKKSFRPSSIATIYALKYENDKKLFVSNQPLPKEVIFKDFYDRLVKNKADVTSAQGKAITGTIDGQSVGSLVTEKTWVILNAPSGISGQELAQLVSSLQKL